MRSPWRRGVPLLLAFAGACPVVVHAEASGQAASFIVTGVVRSARDGSPIPRAQVTLRPERATAGLPPPENGATSPGDGVLHAESDGEGRFRFEAGNAGRWQLSAERTGYHLQLYQQHGLFSSAVVLSPEMRSVALDFRLQPDAMIQGFVVDDAGEAVRGAEVSLTRVPGEEENARETLRGTVARQRTDDRGHFEMGALSAGKYLLSVRAQPWYASNLRLTGAILSPELDVAYAETWYPAATDREDAESISLAAGEEREADVALRPVPSTHLRVRVPTVTQPGGQETPTTWPQIERVTPEGLSYDGGVHMSFRDSADVDMSGLAPGLYRVRLPGDDGQAVYVRVPEGARALDLSSAVSAAAVSFHVEGSDGDQPVRILLTNVATGTPFFAGGSGGRNFRGTLRRRRGDGANPGNAGRELGLDVPPGRYRVSVAGSSGLYLAGISATGAVVSGDTLDLKGGHVDVVLRVSSDSATVHGFCRDGGRPVSGAMVALVPASLGEDGSVALLRRDESNSDGSFDLPDVVPGEYILTAIENGWTRNWQDPATLERSLLSGTPLVVKPGTELHQELRCPAP